MQLGLPYGINNPHGKPSLEEAFAILDAAKDLGISKIDTADTYGNSEEILGNYLAAKGGFELYSKFTFTPEKTNITACLNRSLLRLQQPKIAGYSFHKFKDFSDYRNLEELPTLIGVKTEHLGISVYSNQEFLSAIKSDLVGIIQIPLNLLDHKEQKENLLSLAKKAGKILHVRSVYLQGLFFKDPLTFPQKLRPLLPHIERLKMIASGSNLNLSELAFLYPFSIPEIDAVLVGVESAKQLREGMGALAKGPLSSEACREIEKTRVEDSQLLSPVNW